MNVKKTLLKAYHLKIFRTIEKCFYFLSNKKPWSLGYYSCREEYIAKQIKHNYLKHNIKKQLPRGYGFGFDERVIEYPWILLSIPPKTKFILDAGSILNYQYILDSKQLAGKDILISNLNPESEYHNDKNISYLYGHYGDLRNNVIKNDVFDVIVCGSVLEHVGMDNSYIYKNNKEFNEKKSNDYIEVVREFKRILKKNGICLISIPFGKHQNLGWLQVFDNKMVNKIIHEFAGSMSEIIYFKYSDSGWQLSNQSECSNSKYFDIHNNRKIQKNRLAAAESIVCIKITKK